jgi:hypothetical protein
VRAEVITDDRDPDLGWVQAAQVPAELQELAAPLALLDGVVVISVRDFSISPEPQVSEGAGVVAGTSRSRFGYTGK